MTRKLLAALVLLAAVALASGCGPKISRTVDPRAGEFYTEEEFQSLSKEQREAYCATLLAAYDSGQDCADRARSDLGKERTAISDLKNELKSLRPKLKGLSGEVASLKSEIAYYEGLPRTHIVEKGEFLYKISGYERMYADPYKWKRIYRANRGLIEDPNLIYPDWELTIPRDWPRTHTVREGENLWRIAGYWEVYDRSTMWSRIYEANKAEIKDPDLIHPGQALIIPR